MTEIARWCRYPLGIALPVLLGVLIDQPLPGLWVGLFAMLVMAIDPGGQAADRVAGTITPVLAAAAALVLGSLVGTTRWFVIGIGLVQLLALAIVALMRKGPAARAVSFGIIGYAVGAAVPDGLAARRALLEMAIGALVALVLPLGIRHSGPPRSSYRAVTVLLVLVALASSAGLFVSAASADPGPGYPQAGPPRGRVLAGAPSAVVILAAGFFSSLPKTETYDPLTQKPRDAVDIESYFDPRGIDSDYGSRGCQSRVDLATALRQHAALPVPFSYRGVRATIKRGRPLITVRRYGVADPSSVLPDSAANLLADEIRDLQRLWPSVPVLVVGHSEGGLVAERFFMQRYTRGSFPDIKGIFSLDSPVNGVRDHGMTAAAVLLTGLAGVPTAPALARQYTDSWRSLDARDQAVIARDAASGGVYVAVGTAQDAVYRIADLPLSGLQSQLLLGSRGYASRFNLLNPAAPPSLGWDPAEWASRALASHGCVMASPPVIRAVVGRLSASGSPPTG